ncbi:heterokaryon incompatibility protein-domain-containing protein [Amylocarpus encephaloides]|uniref:Heterokaryon incompatibility protein-domain-containing protein n=1 Tax=Amylocarpus encephaloides TaxID=45428 RepID=A0A9P7YDN9_9HELO|nr:heterokaryon incompatibility protein-domain-containing protein [Amylocarpus encephaloides]
MGLCDQCLGFDIRALLLESAGQKPEATRNTDRNFADTGDLRPAIPHFYLLHETLVALKISAEQGCQLCQLFWQTWMVTAPKTDFTEEWLDRIFEGKVYLGCSLWSVSRQGVPYVTLSQKTSDGRNRTLSSFEAFAERDHLPDDGEHLLGRAVYSDPSSAACISVAKEWMQECLNDHEQCNATRGETHLPTRVIEVGDDTCRPKLVTTNGKVGTWIALSYCWGGDSKFVLNEKKRAELEAGVPVENFPGTLRDAILITRRLRIKYIWIDALCIQQDSKEDWAREASKMRDVYSGAVLTVIAANSPSTISGIFSTREQKSARVPVEWKASVGSKRPCKVFLRLGSELWDHKLQASRLMTRGWTLQEGLLAPRTLSYGKQQMIWECSRHQSDEGGRITRATEDYRVKGFLQRLINLGKDSHPKPKRGLLSRLSLRMDKPDEWWKPYGIANPYDKWYDIVQQFTGRSLTKDSDTLPALSGIAKAFQSVLDDTYCAGLWKKDILCSLMWVRSPSYPADNLTRFVPARPSTYLAPSWSWASIAGKEASMIGNWKNRECLPTALNVAKVVSISTILEGSDPFGQVIEGGELVLKARFCRINSVPPTYSLSREWPTPDDKFPEPPSRENYTIQEIVYNNLLIVDALIYEFFQQHKPHQNQHFGLVELVRWDLAPASRVPGMDFLIVESTGKREGEYRKVGQLALRKEEIPNKDAVTPEQYANTVQSNKAFDEIVEANWRKKTVILV